MQEVLLIHIIMVQTHQSQLQASQLSHLLEVVRLVVFHREMVQLVVLVVEERVMVVVFHPVVLLQQVKVLMEELVGPLSVLKEEVEVEVVLRQQAKMAETVQEVMVVMDLNYQ